MGVIRRGLRALKVATGVGLGALALTLAAVIWCDAQVSAAAAEGRAIATPVDAAVVLGGGVEGDGRLGYASRRRVAEGVRLLESGLADRLILSGGIGPNHPTTSAAALMRDEAIALGADPARLLLEPRAVSTFGNLRHSLALAEARGLGRLALVSDAYHLTRAGWLAAYLGRPDMALAPAPGFERTGLPARAGHYLREALAWWLNLAKIAAWEALGRIGMSAERRAEIVR